MAKRKLSADEAIDDILRFVEDDDNIDDDDADADFNIGNLEELYDDDDIAAAQQDTDDSISSDEEPENDRPPRKILTRKRLVNSIDKALDPNCFDPHNFGNVEDADNERVLEGFLGPKKKASTKKILWTNKHPTNVGRQ